MDNLPAVCANAAVCGITAARGGHERATFEKLSELPEQAKEAGPARRTPHSGEAGCGTRRSHAAEGRPAMEALGRETRVEPRR